MIFEFTTKIIKLENQTAKLQIWDTCGIERYKAIPASYYKNASCALIVFSLDDKESFEVAKEYIKEIYSTNQTNPPKMILVGNKCDLEDKRAVTYEEGIAMAFSNNVPYIETSAQNGHNVNDAFQKVAESFLGNDSISGLGNSKEDKSKPIKENKVISETIKPKNNEVKSTPISKNENEEKLELEIRVLKEKLDVISKLVKAQEFKGNLLAENIKKVVDAKNKEKFEVDSKGNLSIH